MSDMDDRSGRQVNETWKMRLRVTGSRVLSAVGNLATPVDRPARSESGVNALVTAVTLITGAVFLLIMLVTWLSR